MPHHTQAAASNINYVESMYRTLRKQEYQMKQRLSSNLKAQAFLRNIMNIERKMSNETSGNNSNRMYTRGDIFSQKRATMYHPTVSVSPSLLASIQQAQQLNKMMKQQSATTMVQGYPTHHHQLSNNAAATTTVQPNTPTTPLHHSRRVVQQQHDVDMSATRQTTTTATCHAHSPAPHHGRVTFPVKYDHFDVAITKPLATDPSSGHMSLTINVKNKSSTDVRFCVTFTNAQGKSICVWPIVSETFKDLCDFELLEGKKNVDIHLDTRQIPEDYLEFEGDRPLTLSIILTSHTAMASTISEVVHLQRQYHSLLRQRQQQRMDLDADSGANSNYTEEDDDLHQCNSCGRTAIIRKSLKIL